MRCRLNIFEGFAEQNVTYVTVENCEDFDRADEHLRTHPIFFDANREKLLFVVHGDPQSICDLFVELK